MSQQNDILSFLYQLRILSKEQILSTFFPNSVINVSRGNSYGEKVIRDMEKAGLIEKRKMLGKTYYQTATKGYSELKRQNTYVIGSSEEAFENFKPNCRIRLKDNHVAHQEHLNNFVLKLYRKNPPFMWSYRDDINIGKDFKGVLQPDGVLECENDVFFLEQDMGTENPTQLREKWIRYRKMITNGNISRFSSMTVLFLQKETKSKTRRETIIETINDTVSDITDGIRFDIRIGTEDELFNWFYNEAVRKNITEAAPDFITSLESIGYTVSLTEGLDTGRAKPRYYARIKDKNGNVVVNNGIAEEFIFDENMYQPQSVIYNTMLYKEMQIALHAQNQRNIRYVILESSEGECSEKLMYEAGKNDGVVFTTIKRLMEKKGSERFYKILNGVKYHYNEDYTKMITE